MTVVYLSLGSNIGDRSAYLEAALKALRQVPKTELQGQSCIYETKAWGKTDQADFLNMVCQLETDLSAQEVLTYCQEIEKALGRTRLEHWGPRTIDIDLLFYGKQSLNTKSLTIPHPYLHERAFVLVPLSELAADLKHPVLNKTIRELQSQVDITDVEKSSQD